MATIFERMSEVLKQLLQENVSFYLDEKKLKSGKLILYSFGHFCLSFHILKGGKRCIYKIPIPFDVFARKSGIVLDYTIGKFSKGNVSLKKKLERDDGSTSMHKFYDKIVEIRKD